MVENTKKNVIPLRGTWAIRTLHELEVGSTWRVTLPAGLTLLAEFDGQLVTLWSDFIPLGSARVSLKAGADFEVVDAHAEVPSCRAT